jgi:hypothetical protein
MLVGMPFFREGIKFVDFVEWFCLDFGLIYSSTPTVGCPELMNSVDSHGSLSFPFMMV